MSNGQVPYDHRHGSPQPGTLSRPDSRAQMRRHSSNMSQSHPMAQAPMVQDNFFPPASSAPTNYGLGQGPPPLGPSSIHSSNYSMLNAAQMLPTTTAPPVPHMAQMVLGTSYSQAPRPESHTSYSAPYPPARPRSIPPPNFQQHPPPQSQPPAQNSMSMASPPLPHQQQHHQHQQHQQYQQQRPYQQQQQHQQNQQHQSRQYSSTQHLSQPRPLAAADPKHSTFTPVEENKSMFRGFLSGSSGPSRHPQQPPMKVEPNQTSSLDSATTGYLRPDNAPPRPPPVSVSQYEQTQSTTSVPVIQPPKTNGFQADKKPRLQLQIPSDKSEGGDGGESPKGSGGTVTAATPARGSNSSSMQLPPPSPSANSILSAGATGPPNPFARPPPPQNAYGSRPDTLNTPASALPSHFCEGLLQSPSTTLNYGWGGSMLPSPLHFGTTPVTQTGPGFGDVPERKRKPEDVEGDAVRDDKRQRQ